VTGLGGLTPVAAAAIRTPLGFKVQTLDLSPQMVAYGTELARRAGVEFAHQEGT
jgi:hypothetical protein